MFVLLFENIQFSNKKEKQMGWMERFRSIKYIKEVNK